MFVKMPLRDPIKELEGCVSALVGANDLGDVMGSELGS